MKLVTLDQVKARLRIDTDASDADLEDMIEGASGAVVNYLKAGADVFLDTAGAPTVDTGGYALGVPDEVQTATLLLVGYFYRHRDENPDGEYEMGYLPKPVMALLYPLRDPALA